MGGAEEVAADWAVIGGDGVQRLARHDEKAVEGGGRAET